MVMEVMISKLSKKFHKTLALIKLPGNRGLKQGSYQGRVVQSWVKITQG